MDHLSVPKTSGIYQIKNIVSRESYIGSTVNLRGRCAGHLRDLKAEKHDNSRLQNAWRKYGNEVFEFIVLEEVPNKSRLIEREQFLLDALLPEYNLCGTAGSTLGRTHGPEARAKIGQASRGRVITPEWRANLSKAGKGLKRSPEIRAKMSQVRLGKKATPETRAKMSLQRKGRKLSPEHREAVARASRTPERRAVVSKANSGRVFTPEMRAKWSQVQMGHVVSPETRRKMSESGKLARQRRKAGINNAK